MKNQTKSLFNGIALFLIVILLFILFNFLLSQIKINSPENQLTFKVALLLTIFFGGFGGILQTLKNLFEDTEKIIFENFNSILVGFLSGVGGAFAVNYLFIIISKIEYTNDLKNIMSLIGLNTIAGFLGYRALSGMAGKIEREFQEVKRDAAKVNKETKELISLNNALSDAALALEENMPADLQDAIDGLLPFQKKFPADRKTAILLGRLYKRVNNHEKAIEILSLFIDDKKETKTVDDDYADVLYNRACYNILLFSKLRKEGEIKRSEFIKKEGISDLEKSVNLRPLNKKDAEIDKDFDNIRDNDDFKRIVG